MLNVQVGENGQDFAVAARDYVAGLRQTLRPRDFARWRRNNADVLRVIENFNANR